MNTEKTGLFHTTDKHENPLLLEWYIPKGKQLTETVQHLSEILGTTYTKQELEFAQVHPETVTTEHFLKPIAHLFKNGIEQVNWNTVEKELTTFLHQFFKTTDFASFSSDKETNIFVIAKDPQTCEVLGCIQFLIAPEYENGTVKAALFGINQSVTNNGIEQILMSSIFAILPETQRLFLHTRITNETAINKYKDWGFTAFEGPLPYWIDLEYIADKHQTLQTTALSLVKQNK